MKKLFIFLNILLSSCVVWLIYTHISHTPTAPDKVLNLTPEKHNLTKVGIFDKENGLMPGNLSYIYENNVFIPNRGVQENENGEPGSTPGVKPYTGSFELTGICKMGNTQGAVITTAESKRAHPIRAKFYRVDEQIGETNYKLIEVSPATGSVVISNGSTNSVLELDRNDKGSSKRRSSEVKKQELTAKKAELAFNNVNKPGITPPIPTPIGPSPQGPETTNRKKTAEEIAAIRKKILQRMADQKKKKDDSPNNNKSTSKNRRRTR